MSHGTGQLENNKLVATAGIDQPGPLVFGPYVPLGAGTYHIVIHYHAKLSNSAVESAWDIGDFNPPKPIVLAKGIFSANKQSVSANIKVPRGGIKNMQIRALYNGQGSLAIQSIDITKVKF